MPKVFTDEQLSAIEARRCSLLVSAAAGSGKTTVLAERIAHRVADKTEPLDISRVLVVTFTRASAADLRNKLSDVLRETCEREPSNEYAAAQRKKLAVAQIGTIHSFCSSLLHRYFQYLDIPPDFKIADEGDIKIMRKDIMDELISSMYAADADFARFTDDISVSDRDLSELLLDIYSKLCSYPEGVDFARLSAEQYRRCGTDLLGGDYGELIRREVSEAAGYYADVFKHALLVCGRDEKMNKAYGPAFEYERGYADKLLSLAVSGTYEKIREFLDSHESRRLGGLRGEHSPEAVFFKEKKSKFKDCVEKLKADFFGWDHGQMSYFASVSAEICDKLYAVLSEFEKRFFERKRRYSLLDYGDLERFSYRLLYNEDGSLSDAAAAVREEYDEIYVDEYQDTNRIQDMIFRAISKDGCRFTVGDVKQSIYGFRGAVPDIFSEYRREYGEYRSGKPCGTVFMSKNFRCDRNIIDFSNAVFDLLFGSLRDRFEYGEEDRLVYGKSAENDKNEPVRLCLLDRDGELTEAHFVAAEISKLISSGTPAGNIAILLRSPKNAAAEYEDALRELGIDCVNATAREYFNSPEVLLALCLLHSVDNPYSDVYLAGLMKSPLFGFTMDELVRIRLGNTDMSLYESLKKYCGKNLFKKGEHFLRKLSEYREYAKSRPADELIRFLYRDTGILTLVRDGRSDGYGNLIYLYDMARSFEDGAFRGLYNYLLKLDKMIESGVSVGVGGTGSAGAVRILSIHQSKGLEFEVCFLCECAKRINDDDSKESLIFAEGLGFAAKPLDGTGYGRYITPYRRSVERYIRKRNREEEMRLLYVALTRAKNRLVITATLPDAEKFFEESRFTGSMTDVSHASYMLGSSANFISWIAAGLGNSGVAPGSCRVEYPDPVQDSADTARIDNVPRPEEDDDALLRRFAERFDYVYPYAESSRLPAKTAVSRIYPGVLDDEDAEDFIVQNFFGEEEIRPEPRLRKPEFLLSSKGASAAERGTATHVFMQFCDIRRAIENGVDAEAQRLVSERYMPSEYEKMIRRDMLERFFRSPLAKELACAKRIWREKRFNIEFDASELSNEEYRSDLLAGEKVLVQGVIDCMYIDEEGRLNLLDYKTDTVPQEIRGDTAKENGFFTERYSVQLGYYRQSCEQMMKRPADRIFIYSFDLGREIIFSET